MPVLYSTIITLFNVRDIALQVSGFLIPPPSRVSPYPSHWLIPRPPPPCVYVLHILDIPQDHSVYVVLSPFTSLSTTIPPVVVRLAAL